MHTQKLAIAFIALLVPVAAFARIGETAAQCDVRYGKAIKEVKEDNQVVFRKGGFLMVVQFYQGKADLFMYRKEETDALGQGAKISDNEIETLLKANGGDKKWKKREIISMNEEWQTEDGALLAQYKAFDNMLIIATKGYIEREDAKTKAKEKKQLEGF